MLAGLSNVEVLIERRRAEGSGCLNFGVWFVPAPNFYIVVEVRLCRVLLKRCVRQFLKN